MIGLSSTIQKSQIQHVDPASVSLADVIAALSYALDITEGQPEGHSAKSCLIAMRIAQEIGLSSRDRSALFYGTLLKDAGCSSNAAKVCSLFAADDRVVKESLKIPNVSNKLTALKFMATNVAPGKPLLQKMTKLFHLASRPSIGKSLFKTRCSRGADIAKKLGFSEQSAETIRALDEHWNGFGEPYGLKAEEIPRLARIACLSQTVEVYFRTFGLPAALNVAQERSGTWFDPDLVKALHSFKSDQTFWESLTQADARNSLANLEPEEERTLVDESRLDAIAEGFADVIDAKSPWTLRHSFGVADTMVGMLQQLGYSDEQTRYWRRAALLHDIGKLGVSNLILDKPGKLTQEEFSQVRSHVDHTRRILNLVPCFQAFADDAAAHHEKLDGSGYGLGLTGSQISQEAKVMCVADIFDALSAKRPYRKKQLSLDEVFDIMKRDAGTKLCGVAYEALQLHCEA